MVVLYHWSQTALAEFTIKSERWFFIKGILCFRCLFARLQVTLINSKENLLKFCVLRYGIQSVLYY